MNVVLRYQNPAGGRLLETVKSPKQQVAEFLGVPLPEEFDLGNEDVQLLDYESGIKEVIRERRPWIIIERCVAVQSVHANGKSRYAVWGVTTFTEQMVSGHFPGNPKVPFVDLAKMIAQLAIVAAALQAGNPALAPIGVGSDGSSADAKDLIRVPATVLAHVPVNGYKMGLCTFGESHVYVDAEQVGTVTGIRYLMRPSPELPFT